MTNLLRKHHLTERIFKIPFYSAVFENGALVPMKPGRVLQLETHGCLSEHASLLTPVIVPGLILVEYSLKLEHFVFSRIYGLYFLILQSSSEVLSVQHFYCDWCPRMVFLHTWTKLGNNLVPIFLFRLAIL